MGDIRNQGDIEVLETTDMGQETLSSAEKTKSSNRKVHPPTSHMVLAAITSLQAKKGSSYRAIKKFISDTYQANVVKLAPYVKKFLKSGVEKGILRQTTGKGASGSFKIADAQLRIYKNISSKAANEIFRLFALTILDRRKKKTKKSPKAKISKKQSFQPNASRTLKNPKTSSHLPFKTRSSVNLSLGNDCQNIVPTSAPDKIPTLAVSPARASSSSFLNTRSSRTSVASSNRLSRSASGKSLVEKSSKDVVGENSKSSTSVSSTRRSTYSTRNSIKPTSSNSSVHKSVSSNKIVVRSSSSAASMSKIA